MCTSRRGTSLRRAGFTLSAALQRQRARSPFGISRRWRITVPIELDEQLEGTDTTPLQHIAEVLRQRPDLKSPYFPVLPDLSGPSSLSNPDLLWFCLAWAFHSTRLFLFHPFRYLQ